jgi:hypothetical protein
MMRRIDRGEGGRRVPAIPNLDHQISDAERRADRYCYPIEQHVPEIFKSARLILSRLHNHGREEEIETKGTYEHTGVDLTSEIYSNSPNTD